MLVIGPGSIFGQLYMDSHLGAGMPTDLSLKDLS